ncbi:MAG: hypothetical protein ACYCQK_08005 [Acidiferrobacteraceae bacterium]
MVAHRGLPASAVAEILRSLGPGPIYHALSVVSTFVYHTFTPGLLLIAVYVRIAGTQFDSLSGNGHWARAVRDIVFWAVVVSLYFYIGGLIAAYMNAVYSITATFGSVGSATAQMAHALAVVSAASSRLNPVLRGMIDLVSLPVRIVATLLYYGSLVVVVFLCAFTRITHAIGYSFAFVYGLIAIPVSVSGRVHLLRGWFLLYGFVLLWPATQGLVLALFDPVFSAAVKSVVARQALVAWGPTEVYLLFTVLNLLLSAILILAPCIAYALVNNAPTVPAVAWLLTTGAGRSLLSAGHRLLPEPAWYRAPVELGRPRPSRKEPSIPRPRQGS